MIDIPDSFIDKCMPIFNETYKDLFSYGYGGFKVTTTGKSVELGYIDIKTMFYGSEYYLDFESLIPDLEG